MRGRAALYPQHLGTEELCKDHLYNGFAVIMWARSEIRLDCFEHINGDERLVEGESSLLCLGALDFERRQQTASIREIRKLGYRVAANERH